VFRAEVLGRDPEQRTLTAVRRLNEAIERGGERAIEVVPFEDAYLINIDGESLLAIVPPDLDGPASEPLELAAQAAAARLRVAVAEAIELNDPARLLRALALSAVASVVFFLIVVVLLRVRHRIERPLVAAANEKLAESGTAWNFFGAEFSLERIARRLVAFLLGGIALAAIYGWLTFVLRQFPYSRPWGEVLGSSLLETLAWAARGIVDSIPGLMAVAIVVVLARIATRVARAFFSAVEARRIRVPGLAPDTARPTRKIVVAALWVFALIVAYPYLPGSGTDAFRGVSVFMGVVLSIGSTGLVNQAMSGLILMYSSAMKAGDYVRVADIEGTVMHLGMLSTKIRSLHREIITVPNSVMVASETTNFSRLASGGVPIKTTITLGYDLPWRQVHAILKLAAEQTEGVRTTPEPAVLQRALSDYYVEYQLIAYVDDPRQRPRKLTELHSRILDLCNEHGVQILSPHYVADPESPAVVPRERWMSPPAKEDAEA